MLFHVFMFYTLFLFLPGAHAHNSDFSLLSTNMNGLGNAFKLHLIASLISSCLPLAFILCETKSLAPTSTLLNLHNYALYENPALPVVHSSGKWGVVLGVKKNVQVLHHLQVPPMLNGRVVAVDLILSTAGASPQVLQLIGIYAPSAASHEYSFFNNCSPSC